MRVTVEIRYKQRHKADTLAHTKAKSGGQETTSTGVVSGGVVKVVDVKTEETVSYLIIGECWGGRVYIRLDVGRRVVCFCHAANNVCHWFRVV